MPNQPVLIIPVHDYLQPYLSDLYDNDCIFDKFECQVSSTGTRLLTGSYNNYFSVYDLHHGLITREAKDTGLYRSIRRQLHSYCLVYVVRSLHVQSPRHQLC